MSKELDWDAYRYVLDDPTLDREAFEAHMLGNVDVALAVAEAVLHVDSLRTASLLTPSLDAPRVSTPSTHHVAAEGGWQLTSLAALAAAFLLAIGLLNYTVAHKFNPNASSVAAQRLPSQSLAESWLAIRQTEIVDQSSILVDGSTILVSVRDEDALHEPADFVATESSADDDWLMDAAREFYAQGEAG